MIRLTGEELQSTLRELDQAIYNHGQWLKDLTRSIICRLPYDIRDIDEDAHHQCRFGQWFYGNPPQALREHPAFAAIEAQHHDMHRLAARLLVSSASGTLISPRDYDSFTNSADRLNLEIYSLKQELEESFHNRDVLTGAENRISMLTRLRELRELVNRRIQQCAIVIMDLDHFKKVNDTYGHPVGDEVLVAWVRYLKQHLRPYDTVYRYGGEEFLMSFPSAGLEAAKDLVERIRDELPAVAVQTERGETVAVTASFGIALLDASVSVEESIARADAALYAAKESGRDRACVWEPSMTAIRGRETTSPDKRGEDAA